MACHGRGSNGPAILAMTGVVRSDIRSSFAGFSGVAEGVPLTIEMTLVAAASRAMLPAVAVYVWHCDRLGRYSLDSPDAANQNYLRGVQAADLDGHVTFTTIFPGCYAGSWPHIHVEVFPMLASATPASQPVAISEVALPKATCDIVYATPGYASSETNLLQTVVTANPVFTEIESLDWPAVTGSVGAGLTAAITLAI